MRSSALSWVSRRGKIVSDDRNAPGIEVGRPKDTYRRVRIDSTFGKIAVLVTDGQLSYQYGREMIGYEVANIADTISKAKAAAPPFSSTHTPPIAAKRQ